MELRNLGKWWIYLGYPDVFDMGEDGFPRPGQVSRYYRLFKLKEDGRSWTQQDLAMVLGKKPLAVLEMETKDVGLKDIGLRRLLADLFDIPPLLLGIVSFSDIHLLVTQATQKQLVQVAERVVQTPKGNVVRILEYQSRLQDFWQMNHLRSANTAAGEVQERLNELYRALPVQRRDAEAIQVLLCRYHILLSSITEDLKDFEKALFYAEQALLLANEAKKAEFQALSLYRRASIQCVQVELTKTLDFSSVVDDFSAAYQLRKQLSAALRNAASLKLGSTKARLASAYYEKQEALKLVLPVGREVRAGFPEDLHFLKLNEQRYHLDHAAALIALQRPDDALDELALIPDSADARRHAYRDLLYGQAYEQRGWYPTATSVAMSSLKVMTEIRSDVNVERLRKLQTRLRQSSYGNNPEVARLGIDLESYQRQQRRQEKREETYGS